jgi:hypothetical protein
MKKIIFSLVFIKIFLVLVSVSFASQFFSPSSKAELSDLKNEVAADTTTIRNDLMTQENRTTDLENEMITVAHKNQDNNFSVNQNINGTSIGNNGVNIPAGQTYKINNTDLSAADIGSEPAFAEGIISQYYRGDKTWQTLDANAVGLGNVSNNAQIMKQENPTTIGYVPTWANITGDRLATGLAVGTAANNLVKLNSSSQLPSVNGINLTSLNPSNFSAGTDAVNITAGGSNKDITITPSGTGKTKLNGKLASNVQASFIISNDQAVNFPSSTFSPTDAALVLIKCQNLGYGSISFGIFMLESNFADGVLTKIAGNAFSTAKDTTGRVNFYYNWQVYQYSIQNKTGSDIRIYITNIGP